MKPVKRLANNNYKITSDLEGKLLEEMKDYDVELYSKKRALINCLKEYKIFTPVATYTDGADTFKLSVISDQDDELCPVGSKQLKLVVYSLFNISDHRPNFIEQVKMETQANKNLITLIPDSTEFLQIDKLLGEISRYTYIEQKYGILHLPVYTLCNSWLYKVMKTGFFRCTNEHKPSVHCTMKVYIHAIS